MGVVRSHRVNAGAESADGVGVASEVKSTRADKRIARSRRSRSDLFRHCGAGCWIRERIKAGSSQRLIWLAGVVSCSPRCAKAIGGKMLELQKKEQGPTNLN